MNNNKTLYESSEVKLGPLKKMSSKILHLSKLCLSLKSKLMIVQPLSILN